MKQFKKPSKGLQSRGPTWKMCSNSFQITKKFSKCRDNMITSLNTLRHGGRIQTSCSDDFCRMWRKFPDRSIFGNQLQFFLMRLFRQCNKTKLFACENFGGIGMIDPIARIIPEFLEPGAIHSRTGYNIMCIIQYNSKSYHTPSPLDWGILFSLQSNRNLNLCDHWQAIQYKFYLMQHSLALNVPVQQMLWWDQYASY